MLNPDWDALLESLRAALPQFRVFFVVPSEDRSIRWIRLLHGVGVMDLYGAYERREGVRPGMVSEGVWGVGGDGLVNGAGILIGMCCLRSLPVSQGHGDLCDIPNNLVFFLQPTKPLSRLPSPRLPSARLPSPLQPQISIP